MTLSEIAIITGTSFDERYVSGLPIITRWQFDLHGVEVEDGGCLVGAYGRGKTLAAAKRDYAKQLQNKIIVVNAMTDDRREYKMPPKITSR